MIRNFKVLGLALVAVLAMSAVVASGASAQFTSNSYPTSVTAVSELGNDVFKIDGASVECKGHFTGSAGGPTTEITINAEYTNCKAFGFASANVAMNGCDYIFHSNGAVDVECPAGKTIVITAGNCEVDVGTQTGLNKVTLTNDGNHIKAQANVSGITGTVTKDGFLCPLNGVGHKTGGTYVQAAPVTIAPTSGGTDLTID